MKKGRVAGIALAIHLLVALGIANSLAVGAALPARTATAHSSGLAASADGEKSATSDDLARRAVTAKSAATENGGVRPHYTMDVQVDLPSGGLSARETVGFTNNGDEALSELVFNVTPARKGALRVSAASVDGQSVAATLSGVVLSVPLPTALPPKDSTTVVLDFHAQVPTPGDLRFGRANGVLALGNWYPVLSIYRPGQGWDRHRYVDTGDAFVTTVADYDVRLTVSGAGAGVTVAHGGRLLGHDGNHWTIRSENVRDFALSLSERYATASADIGGTKITAYYLAEHAAGGSVYLQAAAESFRWYQSTLGSYPYPQLTIVETTGNDPGWVGQEYPGIILIGSSSTASSSGMGDYLSYVIAHEVAHQWFYGLVGNNQPYEPWLDEAFATYLGYQYLRRNYSSAYEARWAGLKDRYRAIAASYGARPVNSSIYDFDSESHYFAMVYNQGALFLEDLRGTLGDDAFWQLLRQFVTRYQFKLAIGHDFLTMAEQQAGRDLDALYERYFTPDLFASTLDYAIPGGHFYTQANGQPQGISTQGYGVTNDDGVRFWDEFQRLGGVSGVGYPASRRFVWDGFESQVFQKGVFQWRPETGSVYMVNVFDQISRQGKDSWLRSVRSTPEITDWSGDDGRPWADVVGRHQALLDANQAIKARYFAVADPVTLYGLPMAPITEIGDAYVLRAQRVIIQQWKIDVPWAKAGQVTVANGGDIAKEAGLIAATTMRPEDAPE